MWLSVPQSDVAMTRTTTSPDPATGLGTSSNSSPEAGLVLTKARMLEARTLGRFASDGLGPRLLFAFSAERPQLFLHRIERRPYRVFECLLCFAGGKRPAPHVAHQPCTGNLRALIVMAILLQRHSRMQDVAVAFLEVLEADFNFFLPTWRHGHVTAFSSNVHHLLLG